jgi:hypothetical protein
MEDEGGYEEEQDEEASSSECDGECDREISAPDYENYKKIHSEMEDSKKWRLTTGTVVEDALFKSGVRRRNEQ